MASEKMRGKVVSQQFFTKFKHSTCNFKPVCRHADF